MSYKKACYTSGLLYETQHLQTKNQSMQKGGEGERNRFMMVQVNMYPRNSGHRGGTTIPHMNMFQFISIDITACQ